MAPERILLLYAVIPLWLLAGFADWLCHRRTAIESTSGAPESALHLLLLAEMGIPVLGALYLDVNALVLLVLAIALIAHEITTYVDLRYAAPRRHVGVVEQLVHSVLEMSPLAVLLLLASEHWPEALALFGAGDEPARFALTPSDEAPPLAWTIAFAIGIVALALVPYIEELIRALRRAAKTDATPLQQAQR